MSEDPMDSALQFEVLAATLKNDHGASRDMLEQLAKMLSASYPGGTTISRGGFFMSSNRPVNELTVRFDEWQFQINREKHGSFSARSMKLVRGVALKTNELPIDQCIEEIIKEIMKLADKNAQTKAALNKFIAG